MARVLEINRIDQLAAFRQDWGDLWRETPGASFFQSFEWLEVYWRHFGEGQKLRVLVVLGGDRPRGILPLVVRPEATRAGRLRVLTFPLHAWGSFYGPVTSDPEGTLAAGLEHIQQTPRDWDLFELRWQGAPNTDPALARRAMHAAGFQAYATVWDQTAIVEMDGPWESYWSSRKGAWLRRFRHAEEKLSEQGEVSHVRYRPRGRPHDDGAPRWDLYDTCEDIARRSWQGSALDGTTLSHEAVRGFLRETHQAAAAAGAVDLNLLLIGGAPVAFVYGYCHRGSVYGLRRGYDAARCQAGAGNLLLSYTLRDSFARGDRFYDMGVGSLASKRYFQTRLLPILRFSHCAPLAARAQLVRLKRWWQSRRLPASIAVGRDQEHTADAR
jgi:CelD/BcsL family acetyltransferase involved in cellulose biosynthesis